MMQLKVTILTDDYNRLMKKAGNTTVSELLLPDLINYLDHYDVLIKRYDIIYGDIKIAPMSSKTLDSFRRIV